MKKMLKENKGFSLVELLVALLIMAVIAGTAITLFGGVLDTSKGRADAETAENIKRAILTYINASGDNNLSCLGIESGRTKSKVLIDALATQFSIEDDPSDGTDGTDGRRTTFTTATSSYTGFVQPTTIDTDTNFEGTDLNGKYGPFLDVTKDPSPSQSDMKGWVIVIDDVTQAITVTADETDDSCVVTIK